MKTASDNKDNGDALSEGMFLSNEFQSTKGKTYSIMINGMASYSLDEMSDRKLDECVKQGTQYINIVNRLKKAYNKGLLYPNNSYFIFFLRNDYEKLIVGLSYKHDNGSIMLSDEDWNKITLIIDKLPKEARELFDEMIVERNMFDSYIFVPKSPIVTARYK
jgi:hypothetical protein